MRRGIPPLPVVPLAVVELVPRLIPGIPLADVVPPRALEFVGPFRRVSTVDPDPYLSKRHTSSAPTPDTTHRRPSSAHTSYSTSSTGRLCRFGFLALQSFAFLPFLALTLFSFSSFAFSLLSKLAFLFFAAFPLNTLCFFAIELLLVLCTMMR